MPVKRRRTAHGIKMSQGGRGAMLENMINLTNDTYLRREEAMVQKIPTPITPISMQGSMITKAFFSEKSTVDYIGVWKGKALCFDAKECHQDTFPLKNIHHHQMAFMEEYEKCGGYAFLVLYFTEHDRLYFMPYDEISIYFKRMEGGGRKSFTIEELDEAHFFSSKEVPVPYLDMITKIYGKEDAKP